MTNDAIVAVFQDHSSAEAAVRRLAAGGLDISQFSIVGKGYHTEEKVTGFYNTGDRVRFWGRNGAMWGGLWGLFFGGILMTVPVIGPVVVLGHLAAMVFAAAEGAVVVGGLSALGAAIVSIGIPKDSVLDYEQAVHADGFLIVASGPQAEMARAQTILETMAPSRLELHSGLSPVAPPVPTPASGPAAA